MLLLSAWMGSAQAAEPVTVPSGLGPPHLARPAEVAELVVSLSAS